MSRHRIAWSTRSRVSTSASMAGRGTIAAVVDIDGRVVGRARDFNIDLGWELSFSPSEASR